MNCEGRGHFAAGTRPSLATLIVSPPRRRRRKSHGDSCSAATHVRYAQDRMQLRAVRGLPALMVWEGEEENSGDPRRAVELDE